MQPLDFQEILLRLGSAAAVGALVGLNREITQKPAGMRTHALVSLGAAVITVVCIQFAMEAVPREEGTVLRAIQGVITGIGFIGGGVILRLPQEETVLGLTTAATIWIVAGLGIACGFGAWDATIVTTALTLIILVIGMKVEKVVRKMNPGQHPMRRSYDKIPAMDSPPDRRNPGNPGPPPPPG
jgi:putative Mg2+ transporter-C (MgtC) family protein